MRQLYSHLPNAPVLRVTSGQRVFSGFPSKLTRLLLLTDLKAASRPAFESAIELTALFTAQLTLMHGEPEQNGTYIWRDDPANSPESDSARAALLCLMWEARKRGLDVRLSTESGYVPEQVWRTAAQYDIDLIVLAQKLFGSLCPLISRSHTFETVEGAPCPLLVVEDRAVRTLP
ncbi:MAG: universal stress protein [Verrucomicrobia bacterium]|nr:universal stress protein [Verrucomicrobiota bacterium]